MPSDDIRDGLQDDDTRSDEDAAPDDDVHDDAEGTSARDRLGELGGYIREQRSRAQYSLRHLARLAGVSNPYLSQIERGLRKPSAEILQGIAKALQISSETLYVKAGILEERTDVPDLEVAILRDPHLNERQRAALVEIYRSFRRENEDEVDAAGTDEAQDTVAATPVGENADGTDEPGGESRAEAS